jgi:hypothetical protein
MKKKIKIICGHCGCVIREGSKDLAVRVSICKGCIRIKKEGES